MIASIREWWRRRFAPRGMSCAEARELARRLHESAAWHCGCAACRAWRKAVRA